MQSETHVVCVRAVISLAAFACLVLDELVQYLLQTQHNELLHIFGGLCRALWQSRVHHAQYH